MRTVRQRLSPTGRRGPQVLVILENESACQSHRVCKQANTIARSGLPANCDHPEAPRQGGAPTKRGALLEHPHRQRRKVC